MLLESDSKTARNVDLMLEEWLEIDGLLYSMDVITFWIKTVYHCIWMKPAINAERLEDE